MKAIGVIPARWASSRLEGKVLADMCGKPMIQHVWERAKKAQSLEEVFIACDDERIFEAAQGFGAKVVMTSSTHNSGTERIAKAFKHAACDIIVNIQGDEPLIKPDVIDALAQGLAGDPNSSMATVIKTITDKEDLINPNVVKVVIDSNQNALYFSRSEIPYNRDTREFKELTYFKHVGLYAYRKKFLSVFLDLSSSYLERVEKLEQLRVLEAGYKIKTVETTYDSIGVDTPDDFDRVVEMMKKEMSDGKTA